MRKVTRGKTPGSNGWMQVTEHFVRKFDAWYFWEYRRHKNHDRCICGKANPLPARIWMLPRTPASGIMCSRNQYATSYTMCTSRKS
eukprot:98665-Karenia_brevis.AAC.1